MSFFDDASLVFLPSGQAGKDGKAYSMKPTNGNGDFTFSRGSNLTATRVDSNGLIEKGRENLLYQSNQFDTTWVTSGSPSLSSGQSGYDGSTDAWLYTNNGSEYIYQDETTNVATYSIFAKKGNGGIGDFVLLFTDGVGGRYFDLDNGVLGSEVLTGLIDSKIELVSGTTDWYRCSITFASSTRVRVYASLADNDFASVASIYIQDAQLEIGLVATEYIESGASTGKAGLLEQEPRFDYSGGASCPSLLLEPSRTNIATYSEYMLGFNKGSASSLEANAAISPDGKSNATYFYCNTTTTNAYLLPSFSGTSGVQYAVSFYAKAKELNRIYIKNVNDSDNQSWFDLSDDGTYNLLSGIDSMSIELAGDGWYRCTAVSTSTTTGIKWVPILKGDANEGVYVYGLQIEQGSYPTSYIPNHSGGSVTRGADLGSLSTLPETLSTNYTIFGEITRLIPNDEVDDNIIELTGTASSRFRLLANQNSYTRFRFYPSDGSASVSLYESTGEWSQGSTIKWAFVYQIGSIEGFVNGESIGTTSADMEFTSLFLRTASKLKKILVFNEALSNTDLEILTGTSYESFAAMATALNYTTYE